VDRGQQVVGLAWGWGSTVTQWGMGWILEDLPDQPNLSPLSPSANGTVKSYNRLPPMGPAVRNDPQATPGRRSRRSGGPKVQPVAHHTEPRPMNTPNVTAASTKTEIIDAASELVSIQADTITDLQDRQLVLWALVGVLSVLLLLGAH